MRHPRPRPKLLHEKLFAIREFLKFTQTDMANKLEAKISAYFGRECQIHPGQISNYENAKREPNVFVLIAYIHLAQLHLESVADDDVTIEEFRKRLGKEFDHVTSTNTT